jgi:hypothetical protein
MMKKAAFRLGTWGAALGMLAGLVELGIGSQIRPWIGNKENPAGLGLLTVLLSGIAFVAILSPRKNEIQTNDRKLVVFLGAIIPALICFTTVGRLWYLPGSLLIITACIHAFNFWIRSPKSVLPTTVSNTEGEVQITGCIGSLFILLSVGLAFWNSSFGLFQSDVLFNAEQVRVDVLPMDSVHHTYLSSSVTKIEDIEVGYVGIVYILFILGATIALIASLVASRLFLGIGDVVAVAGLGLFILWLPLFSIPVKIKLEKLIFRPQFRPTIRRLIHEIHCCSHFSLSWTHPPSRLREGV